MLSAAIEASLDHLRPWMPWAAEEPKPLAERVAQLRRFRGQFDHGSDFIYGIFERDESAVVGGTGLHPRIGPVALEIGYWTRADRGGAGLATEAAAALTRVAFEVCLVEHVQIRTDPANERSRAIPRKLGFAEDATLRKRLLYPEPRDLVIYSLFRDELSRSPAAAAAVEAYDAVGDRVL